MMSSSFDVDQAAIRAIVGIGYNPIPCGRILLPPRTPKSLIKCSSNKGDSVSEDTRGVEDNLYAYHDPATPRGKAIEKSLKYVDECLRNRTSFALSPLGLRSMVVIRKVQFEWIVAKQTCGPNPDSKLRETVLDELAHSALDGAFEIHMNPSVQLPRNVELRNEVLKLMIATFWAKYGYGVTQVYNRVPDLPRDLERSTDLTEWAKGALAFWRKWVVVCNFGCSALQECHWKTELIEVIQSLGFKHWEVRSAINDFIRNGSTSNNDIVDLMMDKEREDDFARELFQDIRYIPLLTTGPTDVTFPAVTSILIQTVSILSHSCFNLDPNDYACRFGWTAKPFLAEFRAKVSLAGGNKEARREAFWSSAVDIVSRQHCFLADHAARGHVDTAPATRLQVSSMPSQFQSKDQERAAELQNRFFLALHQRRLHAIWDRQVAHRTLLEGYGGTAIVERTEIDENEEFRPACLDLLEDEPLPAYQEISSNPPMYEDPPSYSIIAPNPRDWSLRSLLTLPYLLGFSVLLRLSESECRRQVAEFWKTTFIVFCWLWPL